MGFVRKTTGLDLTGGGARRAAEQASERQIAGTEKGLEALRADLAPFREIGSESANLLLSSVFAPKEQTAQEVLQDPFFKALSEEQNRNTLAQRAALGLGGSGGTEDILQRNLLLLGDQFRQQNLQNQMSQNQLRFNQLMGISGLGQASAAQTGAASQQALTNIGGLQGVAPLARAQQQGQLTQMLGQFGGAIGGAAIGGLTGGGGLGGLSSMFGGGQATTRPQTPFFGLS